MTKILIAVTSHAELGATGCATGAYLPEIAHPYHLFNAAGFAVDFVSPRGGRPPLDGVDRGDPLQAAFLDDPQAMAALDAAARPAQVDPADYDAIFYAGGHGVMWDFPADERLAAVAAAIYERGGVVAAVCHGPAGLVNVRLADGSFLVAGKELAAFTNEEEAAVGLSEVVPFLLETALRERGAALRKAPDFAANTVASGRLVTGQNPASATGVAEAVAALLGARGERTA